MPAPTTGDGCGNAWAVATNARPSWALCLSTQAAPVDLVFDDLPHDPKQERSQRPGIDAPVGGELQDSVVDEAQVAANHAGA